MRWSLVVDDKTDQRLRAFLGLQGAKKGDFSKFVEKAVLDRIFSETVKAVKDRNADSNQQFILDTVDDAVKAVRADRS
jgi:hypothetical protein